MSKIDISKIDSAMATKPADADGVKWYLPFEAPMSLLGLPWFDENADYERLPLARPESVTQFPNGEKTTVAAGNCGAFILSSHTAGVQVRFRTNSTRFFLQGVMRECMFSKSILPQIRRILE